jgi:hypothetical protein
LLVCLFVCLFGWLVVSPLLFVVVGIQTCIRSNF